MKYRIPLFLLFLVIPGAIYADMDSVSADTGIVSFQFKNINFLRDNEYSNPITEGYTLLGYLIQPTIVYSPIDKIKLSLGVQILNYAGTDRIRSPGLIFSTSYKFTPATSLTLGSLDGCDKHQMSDPHFSRERLYTAYTESGLRLVTESNEVFNDTWLNWENFIFKGDSAREIFHIGESFNYISPNVGRYFNFEIPVQMNIKHLGGQISDYPEYVETFFNGSFGLKINYSIGYGRYGRVSAEYQQFRFQYISPHGNIGIEQGNASWIKLHYNYKSVYFGSFYWKGNNFYAPDGNQIYSSISNRFPGTIIANRSIWTNCLYFTLRPTGYFEVFAGLDTYWDINREHLDTAITLHLYFNKMITLKK